MSDSKDHVITADQAMLFSYPVLMAIKKQFEGLDKDKGGVIAHFITLTRNLGSQMAGIALEGTENTLSEDDRDQLAANVIMAFADGVAAYVDGDVEEVRFS